MKTEAAIITKGRKRQPPKSGSQNARRALVETEIVWETSSALFLVSSGSLPPMLPSLSSTPRCRWSRKHHSMSRKQDDGERMGTLAAVRVSSYRVEPRTIIQALLSPFASSLATPSRRRHAPGPGQQLHTPKTQDVCSTWPQSPLQCKDQVSREQSLSFNRRLPAPQSSFLRGLVTCSSRDRDGASARSGVSACFSKLSSRMADERSVVPSLRNMALAIAVWPRAHV